ncbi:MAG: hypothetical protein GX793_00730 [Bacteroidales bacterium]|jgi:hypothetical protein|nr:hypothetical protein [Bacteroidales bacterium]MDY0313537.1 hypothetical protein [Bacteroidales bacterium]NLB85565.1 hypothetical protein [Bacteroidales bacterium]
MNRIKLFLIIIAVALFYYGCDSSGKTIHIDQETKDYCLFKQGSYWIYQDSATLETDSIVIETNPYFTSGKGGGTTDAWETYTYSTYVQNNNTNNLYNTIIRPGFDAEFDNQKPIWYYMDEVSSNASQYKYYSFHNGSIGEKYLGGFNSPYFYSKFELIYQNYKCNEIVYENVKMFLLTAETIPEETLMKLYWAKHIGLVRIEDYSDTTKVSVKNLIRYNVENYEN